MIASLLTQLGVGFDLRHHPLQRPRSCFTLENMGLKTMHNIGITHFPTDATSPPTPQPLLTHTHPPLKASVTFLRSSPHPASSARMFSDRHTKLGRLPHVRTRIILSLFCLTFSYYYTFFAVLSQGSSLQAYQLLSAGTALFRLPLE